MKSNRVLTGLLTLLVIGVWGLLFKQGIGEPAEAQSKKLVWEFKYTNNDDAAAKLAAQGWEPYCLTYVTDANGMSLYHALKRHK